MVMHPHHPKHPYNNGHSALMGTLGDTANDYSAKIRLSMTAGYGEGLGKIVLYGSLAALAVLWLTRR